MSERIFLAPFQGITGKAYRNALSRCIGGYDAMYAPFVSGVGHVRINPSKLQDVLPLNGQHALTVPQIISTDGAEISLFAKTLGDHGYTHINLNIGCPFARIANKKKGCGILPYPDLLDSILEKAFSDMPMALSVKTRLGYHRPEEIYAVLEVLNRYPLLHLIIHPRTGTQLYRGEINIEGFRDCLRQSKNTLVYNGDIYHHTSYLSLKTLFPQAGTWMLGRGALIDPFLAWKIKGQSPPTEQRRKRIMAFHQAFLEAIRSNSRQERKVLGLMKALWYYMAGGFVDGKELLVRVTKANNLSELDTAVQCIMEQEFAADPQKEHYFRFELKHV